MQSYGVPNSLYHLAKFLRYYVTLNLIKLNNVNDGTGERHRWDSQGRGNVPFRNLSYGHTVVHFICCFRFLPIFISVLWISQERGLYDEPAAVQSLRHVRLFVPSWATAGRRHCPSLSPGVCSNACPLSRWHRPPSHAQSPPSPPALNLPQHQGHFQWVGASRQVAEVLETVEWNTILLSRCLCCAEGNRDVLERLKFKGGTEKQLGILHSQ